MVQNALEVAGGLGLFLLGMVILSQGLRDLAGAAIHRALRRFTRNPTSGALTGATATALVQSSSVTTVTAVGFASAGLLTFPQALGIVFGANVGTTITGWIVAWVGFKLELGTAMPVVVLAGALLRVFGRGRLASAGLGIAGFGLAFVGIEMLREGSAAFEGLVTPEQFPADSVAGRLRLVGVGVVFTLVTQSSSAGVASALAAISGGAIGFPQAAALVIGMDVGTTVTAGFAAIGASLAGRRTGWAHVIYNVMTAAAAFLLLPMFVLASETLLPGVLLRQPELSLVAFHTAFNLVGVVAVLPLTQPFARLVERVVPDRPTPLTERLDRRLLSDPEVAVRAIGPTLVELAQHTFEILRDQLVSHRTSGNHQDRRELLQIALGDVENYLSLVEPTRESAARRRAALHVVDQLNRLLAREAQHERVEALDGSPLFGERTARLAAALVPETAPADALDAKERVLEALCADLSGDRVQFRNTIGKEVAPDALAAADALALMDAYRWLERVAHHAWRAVHHLRQLTDDIAPAAQEPAEPDENHSFD